MSTKVLTRLRGTQVASERRFTLRRVASLLFLLKLSVQRNGPEAVLMGSQVDSGFAVVANL